jgi:hypothetical protein
VFGGFGYEHVVQVCSKYNKMPYCRICHASVTDNNGTVNHLLGRKHMDIVFGTGTWSWCPACNTWHETTPPVHQGGSNHNRRIANMPPGAQPMPQPQPADGYDIATGHAILLYRAKIIELGGVPPTATGGVPPIIELGGVPPTAPVINMPVAVANTPISAPPTAATGTSIPEKEKFGCEGEIRMIMSGAKDDLCTFCGIRGSCEVFLLYTPDADGKFRIPLTTYRLHTGPSGNRNPGYGDPCGVAFAHAIRAFDLTFDFPGYDIQGFTSAFLKE